MLTSWGNACDAQAAIKILRRLASSTETLLIFHVIPYYSFWTQARDILGREAKGRGDRRPRRPSPHLWKTRWYVGMAPANLYRRVSTARAGL